MVARGPAGQGAVGGGDALLAEGVGGEAFEMFGAERAGRAAGDAETQAGDAAGEKRHAR